MNQDGEWRMYHELRDHFTDPNVVGEIECSRFGWVDHILRRSKASLLKDVMTGVMVGGRLVERMKARWWYQVLRNMTTTSLGTRGHGSKQQVI